jgi:hypothetical protein
MATFFWIMLPARVLAAAFAPALAQRRELRRARLAVAAQDPAAT